MNGANKGITQGQGRRSAIQVLLAAGVGVLGLAGISEPLLAQEDFKMAIVLPGIITDNAWNQAGYEGLVMAEEELGIEIAYVEKVPQSDQAEALADFARREYDLVIGHGGEFDAAVSQVAEQFPETFFVVTNGAITGENIASLQTDHLQASYLAGVIAGSMTETDKLAFITAQSFRAMDQEYRGFELGAMAVNPDVEVSATYTGDWDDVAKSKEATLALISSGADIIYQSFDNAFLGVFEAAKEGEAYTFGNVKDQLEFAPEVVLTSTVQDISLALKDLAARAVEGDISGEDYIIGLENSEVVYLGEFGEMVPEEVIAEAEAAVEAIKAGEIGFEDCTVEGEETWCLK